MLFEESAAPFQVAFQVVQLMLFSKDTHFAVFQQGEEKVEPAQRVRCNVGVFAAKLIDYCLRLVEESGDCGEVADDFGFRHAVDENVVACPATDSAAAARKAREQRATNIKITWP